RRFRALGACGCARRTAFKNVLSATARSTRSAGVRVDACVSVMATLLARRSDGSAPHSRTGKRLRNHTSFRFCGKPLTLRSVRSGRPLMLEPDTRFGRGGSPAQFPPLRMPGATLLTRLKVYNSVAPDGQSGGTPHCHLACSELYFVLQGMGAVDLIDSDGFRR